MTYYKERSDFMGGKNTSTRQKKNSQKQTKANTQKNTTPSTPYFDYNQFCKAIIEANRTIREEEQIANQKVLEEDHMTKLLVELLNILFTFAMAILGIFAIASVVLSFTNAFASENNAEKMIWAGCWIVFIAGVLMLLLVKHLKKQGKISLYMQYLFCLLGHLLLHTSQARCCSLQCPSQSCLRSCLAFVI